MPRRMDSYYAGVRRPKTGRCPGRSDSINTINWAQYAGCRLRDFRRNQNASERVHSGSCRPRMEVRYG
jgi:hypothetical protein